MRIMLFASMDKKSHGYLTFGPSLVVYNMRESNDPVETIDETFYHQMFVRLGFEQSITVASKFNFLWGILAKADPIALAGGDQSKLNGTYFGGLKLGLQFGL